MVVFVIGAVQRAIKNQIAREIECPGAPCSAGSGQIGRAEMIDGMTRCRIILRGIDPDPAGSVDHCPGAKLLKNLGNSSAIAQVEPIARRPHIGGNAYDRLNAAGVMIHQYGPHIFHINSAEIFDYLSQFTAWRHYEHRVLAQIGDQQVPFPINRTTLNLLFGLDLATEVEAAAFLKLRAEAADEIRTSEDVVVAAVGRELYEIFFRGYTRKQWGLDPAQLDKAVAARVPARTDTDDRYFLDRFQAMPADGYTAMFTRITEYKHLTGQQHPSTSITREYPCAEGDPYYPVPRPENHALYKRYEALAQARHDVTFVGRLATYRYYNMDQIVGQALATFRRRFAAPTAATAA